MGNSYRYQTADPLLYGQLKEWARKNRRNATTAEMYLWEDLKKNKTGHKFLFQHIIGSYIVDFLCRDEGLVIEVDGGYHSEPRQIEEDEIRTRWLNNMGYHVIRFTNEEIIFDIDHVLEEIYKQFD